MVYKKGKIENNNFNISINNIEIKRSDHVKYLGVYIDDKMNWSYHINHLTQHWRNSIGLICKIRHYVKEKTTRIFYYALVYSHLQYGITSSGFADAFYMKPLNTLHNNVLRIIANCGYRTKLSPVYKQQNILKLEDIHKLEVGKLVFKIINKMENHNNIEFYLLNLEKFITTRLEKQKIRLFISHKSKLILEKNQFNMQEQYYGIKYLIPLILFLLLLSKKNIKY